MAAARDLLDVVPIPDGPCVVVWRRAQRPGHPDLACDVLLVAIRARNPEAVLLILGCEDGFDILDETDMARLGWMRSPSRRHPSQG